MRLRNLDLNLLVALDALLTDQQVTRAGERLLLSQPAMSGALARLRTHFSDELIVKIGRKMVLTPLAESLRTPVREVVLRAQATMDMRPDFNPQSSQRHFAIVASDFVDRVLLGPLVRGLASTAPGIIVELLDPLGRKIVEDLDRGDVDFLIIPEHYASEEHPMEVLFRDTLVAVVWSKNTLVGEELSLETYLSMQHVAMNFGRAHMQGLEGDYLDRLGYRRTVSTWTSSFVALPQMIVETNRVTTVPRLLAVNLARHLPLKILTPPVAFPEVSEVVQWHQYRDKDPAIQWMRSILHNGVNNLLSSSAPTPDRGPGAPKPRRPAGSAS